MNKQIIECYNCKGKGWVAVYYNSLPKQWTCPVCNGKQLVKVTEKFASSTGGLGDE